MDIKRSVRRRINVLLGKNKRDHSNAVIFNLYGTNYSKTVLISYLTTPFRTKNDFTHQNYLTSHIVAESFSDLGYNVDVVDYSDAVPLDMNKYAVIFGMGRRLENSFYNDNRSIPRIYFVTGAHDDLHNKMGLKSIKDFYALTGLWIPEETNILTEYSYYSVFNADFAIILAQGYIYEDYQSRYEGELFSLNNNILHIFSDCKPKSASSRTTGFLYLSGGKQLTKGLPILLEVAKKRRDLQFYVVVPSLNEKLENHYAEILTSGGNVSLFKNLKMDGIEMKDIINACSYVVAPSYIDGLPGGTIEPMSAGLIPIVSQYCGFPKEEFIIEMEHLSPSGLNTAIDKVLKMDDQAYMDCSKAVKDYTLSNFSVASVKQNLINILKSKLH